MSAVKVIHRGSFYFQLISEHWSAGAKSIVDFRLRIADWNIKLIAHSKSEIRNLHSKILSTPGPRLSRIFGILKMTFLWVKVP
jgi:hypothetical protein